MSKEDYIVLGTFVRVVLERLVKTGDLGLNQAYADLMHPLAAWDKGDSQEFVPCMKMMLDEWKNEDAEGSY